MLPDIFKRYPGFRARVRDIASVDAINCGLFNHVLSKPGYRELIAELSLVPGPPPARRQGLLFCERWKIEKERQKKESRLLCRELAERNKKYSRYVYPSFVDTPSRYHQGKVFRCSPLRSLPGMPSAEAR